MFTHGLADDLPTGIEDAGHNGRVHVGDVPSSTLEPFIIGMPATHTLSLMAIFSPARGPDVAPLIEHLQYQALSRLSEAPGRNPASRGYFTANVGSRTDPGDGTTRAHRP